MHMERIPTKKSRETGLPLQGADEQNYGFTLIELSIVLVIIGLIVGGILVGQDLIKAAQIRATVSQIEKYQAAVNTFKAKYNYLPGDMPGTEAQALGFFVLTGAAWDGTTGYGDGNGQIVAGASTNAGPPSFLYTAGESTAFWRHLSDAQLIDGNYGSVGNGALDPTTGVPAA